MNIIPLEFDKNGNVKYFIDPDDLVWGCSLWTYESPNETTCTKLAKKIPSKFKKELSCINFSSKYIDYINNQHILKGGAK